jgi:hypothetical protein
MSKREKIITSAAACSRVIVTETSILAVTIRVVVRAETTRSVAVTNSGRSKILLVGKWAERHNVSGWRGKGGESSVAIVVVAAQRAV